MQVSSTGKGSLRIDASALSSSTYQYSLIADGRIIDTNKWNILNNGNVLCVPVLLLSRVQ
jgi:hypothetical protein